MFTGIKDRLLAVAAATITGGRGHSDAGTTWSCVCASECEWGVCIMPLVWRAERPNYRNLSSWPSRSWRTKRRVDASTMFKMRSERETVGIEKCAHREGLGGVVRLAEDGSMLYTMKTRKPS